MVGSKARSPALIGWALLCILLLAAGLRFQHLDRKPMWGDEIYSAIRIGGRGLAEVRQDLGTAAPPTSGRRRPCQPAPCYGTGDSTSVVAGSTSIPPVGCSLVMVSLTG